jgi:hypothetical protein
LVKSNRWVSKENIATWADVLRCLITQELSSERQSYPSETPQPPRVEP